MYNYGISTWGVKTVHHNRPDTAAPSPAILSNLLGTSARSTDFVLVYENAPWSDLAKCAQVHNFVSSLQDSGLIVSAFQAEQMRHLTFLAVHGPTSVLQSLSVVYNVDLEYMNHNYVPDTSVHFAFMATPVTVPNMAGRDYHRAPSTLSGERPKEMTPAERSLIVYKLMAETWYGNEIDQYGVQEMLKSKILQAAFPLHDGPTKWSDSGPISERQLLARYWANLKVIHKQQPLNLINRYFGSQVAFYFAFFGFYNKMLVPVSIIGVIFFLFGFCFLSVDSRTEAVCESSVMLCPDFCYEDEKCKFLPLKDACNYTKLSVFFDNYASLGFAVLISIWCKN